LKAESAAALSIAWSAISRRPAGLAIEATEAEWRLIAAFRFELFVIVFRNRLGPPAPNCSTYQTHRIAHPRVKLTAAETGWNRRPIDFQLTGRNSVAVFATMGKAISP
jgi:hypothetical protein